MCLLSCKIIRTVRDKEITLLNIEDVFDISLVLYLKNSQFMEANYSSSTRLTSISFLIFFLQQILQEEQ